MSIGKMVNPQVYYEGGWRKGKCCGFGKTEFQDDIIVERREGGFKKGLLHGWAWARQICITYHTYDAMWHTGGFKEGRYHGYARTYTGSKLTRIACCQNDLLQGYCISYDDSGGPTSKFYQREKEYSPLNESYTFNWLPETIVFNPFGAQYSDSKTYFFDTKITLANSDIYNGSICYGKAQGYGILQRSSQPAGKYDGGWDGVTLVVSESGLVRTEGSTKGVV